MKQAITTTIPVVEIKKDAAGKITPVHIDVRQHREAIPALVKMGLLPNANDEVEPEKGHTVDEFYQSLVAVINDHYGTNH